MSEGEFEDFSYDEKIYTKEGINEKQSNNKSQLALNNDKEKQQNEEKIEKKDENNDNNNKNLFHNNKPQKLEETKQIDLLKKLSGEMNNEKEINNQNTVQVTSSNNKIKIKQIKIINTQNKEDENNKKIENKEQIISNGEKNQKEEQKQKAKEKYDLKAIISNKTYETDIINGKKYITDDTKIKMTRLKDLERQSYLSSVLRSFVSLEELRQFFLDSNMGEKITDSLNTDCGQRLSYAIYKLFKHMYIIEPNQSGKYEPKSICRVLAEKNSSFQFNFEMNPINCLMEILTQLHDELNAPKNYLNSFSCDETNRNDVIEKGNYYYLSLNNSIISQNFSWYELEEIRCKFCGSKKYRIKTFFTFDLDISNIYNKNKKNEIRIYDCLDEWKTSSGKKGYCDIRCNEFSELECSKTIINTPKIFAFLIDRKEFDEDLMKINFAIEENINLRPYMEYSGENAEYQLKAIVSIHEKKYINFVKKENIWYVFDDTKIQKVESDDIFKVHRDTSIQHIPCILFYELRRNNDKNMKNGNNYFV
jgi:hypothetical protein